MNAIIDIFASFFAAAVMVAVILGLGCFVLWQEPSDFVVRGAVAVWVCWGVVLFDPKKW